MTMGLAHSVQVRLVRHAHALGIDPNLVLARYAAERLLYRLSRSPHASRFVLKGALMMLAWLGEAIRPTRDADLLGFGALDAASLSVTFTGLCASAVEPDGLEFDPTSLRVDPIRPLDTYGGQRVTLLAYLGKARLRVQVDVGIGDAVVPEAEWIDYPSLLDLPRPRLRAYRPETTVAEKRTPWSSWKRRTAACETSSTSRHWRHGCPSRAPCWPRRSRARSVGAARRCQARCLSR